MLSNSHCQGWCQLLMRKWHLRFLVLSEVKLWKSTLGKAMSPVLVNCILISGEPPGGKFVAQTQRWGFSNPDQKGNSGLLNLSLILLGYVNRPLGIKWLRDDNFPMFTCNKVTNKRKISKIVFKALDFVFCALGALKPCDPRPPSKIYRKSKQYPQNHNFSEIYISKNLKLSLTGWPLFSRKIMGHVKTGTRVKILRRQSPLRFQDLLLQLGHLVQLSFCIPESLESTKHCLLKYFMMLVFFPALFVSNLKHSSLNMREKIIQHIPSCPIDHDNLEIINCMSQFCLDHIVLFLIWQNSTNY